MLLEMEKPILYICNMYRIAKNFFLILFVYIAIGSPFALAAGSNRPECRLKNVEFCGVWNDADPKNGRGRTTMLGYRYATAYGDFANCEILEEGNHTGKIYSILKCDHYHFEPGKEFNSCAERCPYHPKERCVEKPGVDGIYLPKNEYWLLYEYEKQFEKWRKHPYYASYTIVHFDHLPCLFAAWGRDDPWEIKYKNMWKDFSCKQYHEFTTYLERNLPPF